MIWNGPSRAVRAAGQAVSTKPSRIVGAGASEAVTMRHGYLVTVDGTSPPTCTVTIGASQVNIPGIRYASSYTPAGGDEVIIARNGDDHWILCALAT